MVSQNFFTALQRYEKFSNLQLLTFYFRFFNILFSFFLYLCEKLINTKVMKKIFLPLILCVFVLNGFAQIERNFYGQRTTLWLPSETPTNVIMLIGDGMGTAQVFALIAAREDNSFMRFPFIGYTLTQSADAFTTESAAAGTALATGRRTNNNMVSVCPETREPMETIIQLSNRRGLSTGVIASSSITHATPAAFLSHNINRRNNDEIAEGIVNTNPTLFIGGGRRHFDGRSDGRNLLDSLRVRGFQVFNTLDDVMQTQNPRVAGLLWENHSPNMANGRGEFLKPATQQAIQLLSQNRNGFFLMVESSQIDWLGHDNDFDGLVQEMKDFDNAISAALDFAERDGNTLVIVLGDHETGGLAVLERWNGPFGRFTTFDHSPMMVPIFAFGPGAERFTGIFKNTEVHRRIVELLGL